MLRLQASTLNVVLGTDSEMAWAVHPPGSVALLVWFGMFECSPTSKVICMWDAYPTKEKAKLESFCMLREEFLTWVTI